MEQFPPAYLWFEIDGKDSFRVTWITFEVYTRFKGLEHLVLLGLLVQDLVFRAHKSAFFMRLLFEYQIPIWGLGLPDKGLGLRINETLSKWLINVI